eukprot:3357664-Prymnesium_polylepis.1
MAALKLARAHIASLTPQVSADATAVPPVDEDTPIFRGMSSTEVSFRKAGGVELRRPLSCSTERKCAERFAVGEGSEVATVCRQPGVLCVQLVDISLMGEHEQEVLLVPRALPCESRTEVEPTWIRGEVDEDSKMWLLASSGPEVRNGEPA